MTLEYSYIVINTCNKYEFASVQSLMEGKIFFKLHPAKQILQNDSKNSEHLYWNVMLSRLFMDRFIKQEPS